MIIISFLIATAFLVSAVMWATVLASVVSKFWKHSTVAKVRSDKYFCMNCRTELEKSTDLYCKHCGRKIIMWEVQKDVQE